MRERQSKIWANVTDGEQLALRTWAETAGFATLGDFIRFACWRTCAHGLTRPDTVNADAHWFAELEAAAGSAIEQLVRDTSNIKQAKI